MRIRRVERVGIGERLNELRSKAILEVSGCRQRIHLVPLTLAPLGPTILKPNLEREDE